MDCVKIAEAVHWILSHLQESYSKRWSCCHCVLKTNVFENKQKKIVKIQDSCNKTLTNLKLNVFQLTFSAVYLSKALKSSNSRSRLLRTLHTCVGTL